MQIFLQNFNYKLHYLHKICKYQNFFVTLHSELTRREATG